jgi:hypothetical protein
MIEIADNCALSLGQDGRLEIKMLTPSAASLALHASAKSLDRVRAT